MPSSAFDEVLGLEEQFYEDGFHQGYDDGVKAGRIEGRTFGLEKGFEKYIESGKLYGKSIIWANRMSQSPKVVGKSVKEADGPESQISLAPMTNRSPSLHVLHPLPENQRLAKHVKVLYALTESESLSTENSEEAVSDFDDRFKRAQGKAKVIERIVGETRMDAEISGTVAEMTNDIS